jgi:hypothetical protein
MNEQERAIVRTDLLEIKARLEELREIPSWWAMLSEEKRQQIKSFTASADAFLRIVE